MGTGGTGRSEGLGGPEPPVLRSFLGLEPGRARPTDAGVIGSLPTQKGIATGSEAEVNPLWLCGLGILDLGKDRNCSCLNFRLIFRQPFEALIIFSFCGQDRPREVPGIEPAKSFVLFCF